MNTQQEDRHSMHLASKRCLEDNIARMALFPRFAELMTSLDNSLTATGTIIGDQEKDRRGVATNKGNLRTEMLRLTLNISHCLVSYATIERLPELLAECRITESELKKLADSKVQEKANLINRLGTEHQAELADFGLVNGDLTALPTAINAYFNAIPEPKLTKAEQVQLTAQLAEAQRTTDSILGSIDTLVKTLREREPQFFAGYFMARKINRTGYRTRALEILVQHGVSGEPVAKAKVTVKKRYGTDMIRSVKRTSGNGKNTYQSMPADEYLCIVEMGGFDTATVPVIINEGITSKLTIALMPAGHHPA